MVDYPPQKEDPNRVRLTMGGNLISYPGGVTTRTADLTTSKILCNSILSTVRENYMCIDIKNIYLCEPIERYEYTRMKSTDFPLYVQQQYNPQAHAKNGYVYLGIWRSIYGLPQAGKLANEYLQEKLRPHGYYEVSHTPGLCKHISLLIDFSLFVDDFGVKYVGEDNVRHLIDSLNK